MKRKLHSDINTVARQDDLAKRTKHKDSTRISASLSSLPKATLQRIIFFLNETLGEKIIRRCDPPKINQPQVASHNPPATVYYTFHPLKALSRTSRSFRTLCLELLFHAVRIPATHKSHLLHASINDAAHSFTIFLTMTNVGQTIKSLTLDGDVLNRSAAMLFHHLPCLSSLRLLRSVAFIRDAFPVSRIGDSPPVLQCLKHLALEGMQVDLSVIALFKCVSERLETLIVRESTFEGATPFHFHRLPGTFEQVTTFRYHGSGVLAVHADKYPLTVCEFISRLPNLTTLGIGFVEDELRIREDGSYAYFDSPIGVFPPERTFSFSAVELVQTSYGVRFVRPEVYLRCWLTLLTRPGLFTSKLLTFAVLEDFSTFGKALGAHHLQDSLRVQKRTCVSEFITTFQYTYDTALKAGQSMLVHPPRTLIPA
jgi:hypothetical protein